MAVAKGPTPSKHEFESLLTNTLTILHEEVVKGIINESHLGTMLEKVVYERMLEAAINTPFEGSIELISGQRFPDIVVSGFYGIEVKSTKQKHWVTTGNSVFEGTRVEGVETIYMLFGKISEPIEFQCRLYEHCLLDIAITHSPRYKIDMNLRPGETIFDKIGIPYDELRKLESPIKPIVNYYKEKVLKPGEELWWINQNEEQDDLTTNPVIRMWSSLSKSEQSSYVAKSMGYFPSIFGNSNDKYNKLALWLLTSENVVCPSLRDLFTSGGKGEIKMGSTVVNAPRIMCNLFTSLEKVVYVIEETPNSLLKEYWNTSYLVTNENKVETWVRLTSSYLSKTVKGYSKTVLYDVLKNEMLNRLS